MPANRPLTSLLAPERIDVGLAVDTKAELLAEMVQMIATSEAVSDGDLVLHDVLAREARMSTGVGNGLAIPHARTQAASESLLALVILAEPIDYAALDGHPVRLAMMLIGPEADRVAHLHILSRVSRVLSDAVVRSRIEAAESPTDVLAAIRAAEAVFI
jgi:mannitol/fructose-specific phosphotransferase system IIA component (Ntr-type)